MDESFLSLCPQPIAGIDWHSLDLTPRDGFVLSRIDGRMSVRLLSDVAGIPLDEIVTTLKRLETVGAVLWTKQLETASNNVTTKNINKANEPITNNANDSQLDVGDGLDAVEDTDLSPAEQRLINAVNNHYKVLTHWELLELYGSPSNVDIKRAYFAQSRRFHPDRYFGKNLGIFKARLENIFKVIKAAYEVLADDDSKAKYAALHPPPSVLVPLDVIIARMAAAATSNTNNVPTTPISGVVAKEAIAKDNEELERRRQEILDMRKRHRLDSSYATSQAKTYAAAGRALSESGDNQAALDYFRRATLFDPANTFYRQLFEQTQALVHGGATKSIGRESVSNDNHLVVVKEDR
ncbi:MAG: DnaJ domain-containing protein [Deltaproteobacteria bacterium]|nr:DnaJ domain-containing protein [Deltaproteobacteria bacterium]